MEILLNGKEVAKKIKEDLKIEVDELKTKGINPKLAVIMVGNNEASKVYAFFVVFTILLAADLHDHIAVLHVLIIDLS